MLDAAVSRRDAPFLVAMTANAGGECWSGASGVSSGREVGADTVFAIFSMTKAVGATAVMLLVDKGLVALDDPVEKHLPEFGSLQVLDGWNGDIPVLRQPTSKATIRQLATHTAGLSYDIWAPEMSEWLKRTGVPSPLTGKREGLNAPLLFNPGERWQYGTGLDWLGLMVQAVDGRRIDEFVRDELITPLGMKDTAFELTDDMRERLATVQSRAPADADQPFVDSPFGPPPKPEVYGMGHALYSTARDYIRFLRMFLNRGELDGKRVLSESAVDAMLANSIGPIRIPECKTTVPAWSADVALFPGTPLSHSVLAVRTEAAVPGMRGEGAQGWAGICNTHFWLDPSADTAAVIFTQLLPFADPRFMATYAEFERAVYAN